MIQKFISVNGQSLVDVCLNTYGTTDLLYKLLQDNNVGNLDYTPVTGDVFLYDDSLVVNQGINQYLGQSGINYATDINIKTFAVIVLMLSCFFGHTQSNDTTKYTPVNSYGIQEKRHKADSIEILPGGDTTAKFPRMMKIIGNDIFYSGNDGVWRIATNSSGGGGVTLIQMNDSLNNYLRIQTQYPTASISADTLIYPYTSASTWGVNLHWGAGRQSATPTALPTNPLSAITVGGVSQSFSQPSPGSSVSGVQHVTINSNTNTTLSNVVTTTDGKVTTASITLQSQHQIYVGYVNSPNPTDADIIAATGGHVGGAYGTTQYMNNPVTLASPGATLYTVICYPASFGLSVIKIGGLVTTYGLTTRNFTNQYGYTISSNIYISPFPSGGAINYQILSN